MKFTFTSPNGEEYEIDGPEGSSREQAFSVLQEGIKAGYYKPKKKTAAIPGQEGEEERVAQLQAQPKPGLGDKLLGAGEAALSTATGLFSGVQAPVAGLLKSAFGMAPDAEKETARLMEQQTYRPRTEVGQDYTENVGKVLNDVLAPLGPGNLTGLVQARPIPGLLRKDRPVNTPMPLNREAILKGATINESGLKPEPINRYEQMVRDLGAEPTPKETPFSGMVDTLTGRPRVIDPEFRTAPDEPAYVKQAAEATRDDALVARLEAAINKQNPARDPMAVTPEGQAYTPDIGTELGRLTQAIDQGRGLSTGEMAVGTGKNIERQQGPSGLMGLPEGPRAAPVGLSLGENTPGVNKPFERAMGPSGLMGLPERPATPPIGLSTGETTPGKLAPINRTMGPSNLMGEPVPDPVGLSTGEGMPGQKKDITSKVAPVKDAEGKVVQPPFDPFGSAGATARPRIGKFGQGGAIHPQLAEDLYNFGKSVVRGVDGLLKPLFRGVKTDYPYPERTMPGIKGTGVYLTEDPGFAGLYAQGVEGGNMRQAYVNLTNPLVVGQWDGTMDKVNYMDLAQRNKWTAQMKKKGHDGVIVKKADGTIAEAVVFNPDNVKNAFDDPRINRFGQGGSAPMINDLAQGIVRLGKGMKAKFTGESVPKPDTINTPRSAATIAAKQAKAAKANAIGLTDNVYSAPATIEEVLANPGKDITTAMQDLTPGQYAVIRKNAANNVLKFTNRLFTESRLSKIKDSVALITGKGAYNDLLKKLTPEEKMTVAQDAMFLDKNGSVWNDAKAEQLGYTPAMKAFMDWRMKAHETVANKADGVLFEQGLRPLSRRASYAPSNFDTAYTALVTQIGKDGKFKVVVPLNANSLWEFKQAMKWAKEKFNGPEYKIEELPRRGLNTEPTKTYRGIAKEGLARLLEEMAKLDPRMQAAKAELDGWIEGQTKKLYGHDVHMLRKQGLEGSIGDRPWLDAKRNAEDFFAQEVNHIEEALQYWNYQKPVNETRQLVANPAIGSMKNTVKYLDRYLQHVTGQGLNPAGAALNWAIDKIFAAVGKGSGKSINAATSATREVATIWMMGVWNPTFMNVQLSQTLTGMVPEIARIRNEFGLSPESVATSFGNSTFGLTMIGAADAMGKLDTVSVAPHLVDAYKWMKEHGLTRYNEVEQSHEATQNPKWHQTKQALSLPITIPEKITTPQAFMWAVDMLHQAGKTGDDLYLSAYNAAKYAMTEYHPDEAPMVYQRLGVVGQHVGGLKKFVHNAIDQQASRSMELAKNPAAFSAMLGMTFLTMGAMGLAGVGTLDKLSLSLTDKGLRDHYDELFGTSKGAQGMRDGFASVLTGFDLQTRYSMADLVPGSFTEALVGPHLSKLGKMGASLVEYGMKPSEQTFREMSKQMVPSGLAGTLEENYLVGQQGQMLDKEGQNKYPKNLGKNPDGTAKRFWRSEHERNIREWGGPRPIRERLYDEQKYQADVVQRKKDEKRNDAGKAMVVAIGYGDDKGFQAAMKRFIENEGDISTLDQRIQTYMDNKGLSSKQRAAGTPGDSITSIKKFQRYQEKP